MDAFDQFLIIGGILAAVIVVAVIIMSQTDPKKKKPVFETDEVKKSSTSTPDASSTTTPPPPAPAPVATPRSYSWLWSFVLVFFGGIIALTIYHKVLVPSFNFPGPAPRATAPKPQNFHQNTAPYRTSTELVRDRSIGVEVDGGTTKIRNGGKGLYFAEVPQKFFGTVYFKGYITRFYDGQLILRVNGAEFQNLHKGGGRFWKVFSFPASVLHSGTNSFVLSSPGEDILVERMEIEIN